MLAKGAPGKYGGMDHTNPYQYIVTTTKQSTTKPYTIQIWIPSCNTGVSAVGMYNRYASFVWRYRHWRIMSSVKYSTNSTWYFRRILLTPAICIFRWRCSWYITMQAQHFPEICLFSCYTTANNCLFYKKGSCQLGNCRTLLHKSHFLTYELLKICIYYTILQINVEIMCPSKYHQLGKRFKD